MSVDLRMPNINGATEKEQLYQIRSYLYQMIPQLQWALENINSSSNLEAIQSKTASASGGKKENNDEDALSTFNSIKSLIIKSADIVNAYYEEIDNLLKLSGYYVAESEFGTFKETTETSIKANSDKIEQIFSNREEIDSKISELDKYLIEVKANIKTGLLYYDDNGVAVYGVEVGQTVTEDGVETFNKYARFTSDRLSFYDSNDNEVAYISDKKLYITNIEVTSSFSQGGFVETTRYDKSIVTKWVGGE